MLVRETPPRNNPAPLLLRTVLLARVLIKAAGLGEEGLACHCTRLWQEEEEEVVVVPVVSPQDWGELFPDLWRDPTPSARDR